ncbi:Uncharacterized protein SCF082_LOCUS18812, partial [Durusdinium trenchii]
ELRVNLYLARCGFEGRTCMLEFCVSCGCEFLDNLSSTPLFSSYSSQVQTSLVHLAAGQCSCSSAVMELHRRVPAELWCVTYSELFTFVEDVRGAWCEGNIPNAPGIFADRWHEDAEHGPNLYVVNEHFVKPKTLAVGGMSYALWLHPEGLPCQVFVSHAWVEGIFEFALGVRSAWPGGHGLRNMYVCLLANPQNLDMQLFLNVEIKESPFARALGRASHLLVIPNTKTSIYSRLWCVYEAYLGITMGKICLMPATPHRSMRSFLWLLSVPLLLGFLLSCLWRFVFFNYFNGEGVFDLLIVTGVATLISAFSAMVPPHMNKCVRLHLAVHQLIICISGAICLPWWSTPYDASLGAMASFLHHFLPVAVQLFNTLCIYHLQLQVLEIQQLMDQANYLSCQTVQEAQCTNPTDEERIRSAIAGAEDDVDVAIRVLMLAGAYTKSLRHAYESGEDIRGAGILNLKAKATIGGVLWCMAGLDGTTRFDRRGIATTQMQRDWAFVTVLSAFLVAVVMPLWLRKTRSGPDWIRRTLGLWYFCGLSGLLMPFAVALVQGMDELRTLSLIQRMSFEAQHQASFTTSLVETFSVPFFAVVSLMGALIGSRVAACRRGPIAQTQHLVRIASRTLTNLSSYTRSFRGCSDPHATEPSDTCSETSHASSSSSSSSEGSPKSSVGALPGIWL